MKVILVATDYSKEAENAVEYAAAAARMVGARVVLFHLYKLSVHAMNSRLGPGSFDELYKASRKKLEDRAAEIAARYGIHAEADWHKDDFYTELKQSIAYFNADILVLGMAEKSLEQDMLGNTTTSVINRLRFPVLAIPSGVKFEGIRTILFAADILRGVHLSVLQKVKEVAAGFGAEQVEIFHVSDKVKEIEKAGIRTSTENAFGEGVEGVRYFYKNVESNAVIREIQKELAEIKADMLIMVPNRYGFWGSLIHRSKTRIMASGSQVPLLSLPL
ncbi:universal stress protein [Leadbetterella sp. DM7]|uniref:universal stress protein n=1 Tax=Leadbetterella sp. DM7 TaxID=3235085 RepID=UPI00349E4AD0